MACVDGTMPQRLSLKLAVAIKPLLLCCQLVCWQVCLLVCQPTAEPCEAAGAQAALGQVVHAACILGLLTDNNCVAPPRVARCTIVSLDTPWRWGRLSRVVSAGHRLCGGVVVAAWRWLTSRWVIASWRYKPRLTRGHISRPLLDITLSCRVEHCSLWLVWLRWWRLLWSLWRRYPPWLRVAVVASMRVVRWWGIVRHLGK